MAHKKSGGSARNGRDSRSKRRGVKKFAGEHVIPGNIIIRQCGTRIHPGDNVGMGKDYTIYATTEGYVRFEFVSKDRRRVSVVPERVRR
jgi:large subunit ribosomal protein L27